jgi:drug/metabolite transporter (DMT)-like permease
MTSSWMLVAGFMFATMGVFVKMGAEYFGAAELAFYRSLVTLIAAFVALRVTGGMIRSPLLAMHMIRGLVGAISLIGYFYAITRLPLATAQTLNYTSPIFLAIATTVVLGERFSGWLVVAIALGFGGVALLLQPNFEEGKEGAAMVGLMSGILAAWAYLSVRSLGKLGEPDWRVLFWFGTIATITCAGWQVTTAKFHPITLGNVWLLAGIGVCGTLAQLTMTRAYRTGNTLVVGAFSYSTIVFASIFTYVLWNEKIEPLEWAGMAIIVASGLIAMRVEKKEHVEEAGFES